MNSFVLNAIKNNLPYVLILMIAVMLNTWPCKKGLTKALKHKYKSKFSCIVQSKCMSVWPKESYFKLPYL